MMIPVEYIDILLDFVLVLIGFATLLLTRKK